MNRPTHWHLEHRTELIVSLVQGHLHSSRQRFRPLAFAKFCAPPPAQLKKTNPSRLSSDGNTVIMGGPADNGTGAAWVFVSERAPCRA